MPTDRDPDDTDPTSPNPPAPPTGRPNRTRTERRSTPSWSASPETATQTKKPTIDDNSIKISASPETPADSRSDRGTFRAITSMTLQSSGRTAPKAPSMMSKVSPRTTASTTSRPTPPEWSGKSVKEPHCQRA
jgi:hypothetical protein